MFRSQRLAYFLLLWNILCSLGYGQPNGVKSMRQTWMDKIRAYKPAASTLQYDSGLVSVRKWYTLSPSAEQKAKASRIAEILKTKAGQGLQITEQQLLVAVRYTDAAFDLIKNKKDKKSSYLIYPSAITHFPIQIYADGTSYIHFFDKDPRIKKGGYKIFSRSICLTTENVVASLLVALKEPKQIKPILSELSVLKHLDLPEKDSSLFHIDLIEHSQVILPKDKETAPSKHPIQSLIFQTKLFDGDFALFRGRYRSYHQLFSLSYQAALSVSRFHSIARIHRDIKPGNLFFSVSKKEGYEVELSDFGLSKKETSKNLGKGLSGSRGYIAPDLCFNRVIKGFAFDTPAHGYASDVFSLGMTFYQLIEGKKDSQLKEKLYALNKLSLPPKDATRGSVKEVKQAFLDYKNIHKQTFSAQSRGASGHDVYGQMYLKLIKKMLHPVPEKRPSLDEVAARLKDLMDLPGVS